MFFDNFQVRHDRGRILEENHYYAYGLKIAALSSRAFGGMQNNYLYQGDYSEFDEDLGWNDFMLRSYDPQIGRFLQWDPYDQFASGYVGMGNDPGNLVDEDGGCSGCTLLGSTTGADAVVTGVNRLKIATNTVSTVAAIKKNANTLGNLVKAGGSFFVGRIEGIASFVGGSIGQQVEVAAAVVNAAYTYATNGEARKTLNDVAKQTINDPAKRLGEIGDGVVNAVKDGIKELGNPDNLQPRNFGKIVGNGEAMVASMVLGGGIPGGPTARVITKTVKETAEVAAAKTGSTAAKTGSTVANRLGQQMHKAYKAGDVLDGVRIKEFTLPSGKRIDFIDLENKIIYELKPNNPRAIKLGNKQLELYKTEVEAIYGKGFKTILDKY